MTVYNKSRVHDAHLYTSSMPYYYHGIGTLGRQGTNPGKKKASQMSIGGAAKA